MLDKPHSIYVLCDKGLSLNIINKLFKQGFTINDFIYNSTKVQKLNSSKPATVRKIEKALTLITEDDFEKSLYRLALGGLTEHNIKILQNYGLTYQDISTLTSEKLSKLAGSKKDTLYKKIKDAYEKIELDLGNIPNTYIFSRVESLIENLKPREVVALDEIINYVKAEYPKINNKVIIEFLEKSINNGLIFETEKGYSKKYKKVTEYLSEDFKDKDILLARLNGKTLQEIGDKYGVSKEAIRQKERAILRRMPVLEEMIVYKKIFEEYDWDEKVFKDVFNEPEIVYNLLNFVYEKGIKNILEYLDELPLEHFQKNIILQHYEAFIDYKGNVEFINNKMALFEHILYCYGRSNLITDEEVVEKINDYIKKHQFNRKYQTDINSVRGLADRSDKVIRNKSNSYRYYNYEFDKINLNKLKNLISELTTGVYSMQKIFTENEELMKEINIKSEHELHNLYKRIIKIKNVTYTRMPEFSIGNISKNDFLIKLFHEQAPISLDNFTKFVEENYGLRQNSLRSHIQMFLPEYIHDEVIRVDYTQLSESELKRLKDLLVEDIYTVEQIEKIGSAIEENFHDKFLNNMTLLKIGYTLKGKYVLNSAYGSVERYFTDLIMSKDYFEKDQNVIYKTQTFNMALYELEKNLDVVKIENNTYITTKKLNEAGIFKEDLLDFRNEAIRLAPEGKFFTLYTLRKSGLIHSLEELGFERIFYERIIWTSPNVRTIPLAAGYIFLVSDKDVSLTDFIYSIVYEFESINLYELQEYIIDNYNIDIDIYKIITLVRDSNMYYSEDMCKIYIDKDTFYREVY